MAKKGKILSCAVVLALAGIGGGPEQSMCMNLTL